MWFFSSEYNKTRAEQGVEEPGVRKINSVHTEIIINEVMKLEVILERVEVVKESRIRRGPYFKSNIKSMTCTLGALEVLT